MDDYNIFSTALNDIVEITLEDGSLFQGYVVAIQGSYKSGTFELIPTPERTLKVRRGKTVYWSIIDKITRRIARADESFAIQLSEEELGTI